MTKNPLTYFANKNDKCQKIKLFSKNCNIYSHVHRISNLDWNFIYYYTQDYTFVVKIVKDLENLINSPVTLYLNLNPHKCYQSLILSVSNQ